MTPDSRRRLAELSEAAARRFDTFEVKAALLFNGPLWTERARAELLAMKAGAQPGPDRATQPEPDRQAVPPEPPRQAAHARQQPLSASGMLTLDDVADRLGFAGEDRRRSVRRLLRRHNVPYIRRGARTWLLTPAQLDQLMGALECSASESAARSTTAAARSVSGRQPASSKSILQAVVNARLQRPTRTGSRARSAPSSFTVLAGGRKG